MNADDPLNIEYSLANYFEEAKVDNIPEVFKEIGIWHPEKSWIKPRWHQITGLNGTFVYSRYGLFDQMGTGKTLIAHAWVAWHAYYGNRPICLMPPILLEQFRRNFFITFPGIDKHCDMLVYQGTRPQREKIAQKLLAHNGERFPVLLMTPEIFRMEFPLFQKLDCCGAVMDEAEYVSNPDTKTATAISLFMGTYGEKCSVLMNGTPANNDLQDLYGYIRHLTPDVYRSRSQFEYRHVDFTSINVRIGAKNGTETFKKVRKIEGFRNFKELEANLYKQARRMEKQEVLDLPSLQIIATPVELKGKHKQKYEEFCTAKVMLFEDGTAISGEQASTMRMIAMQAVVQTDILQVEEESAVFAMCDQLVESINPREEKIFIGAYFQKTVERLTERYQKYGARCVYGPNSVKTNMESKDAFINDPACRILVVNYQSGGVGLDGLQKVCSYGIGAEPISVPGPFEQWRDRLHRGGQEKPVVLYVINVLGTIWAKAIKSMHRKEEWNKAVVSGPQLLRELLGEDDVVE